MAVQRLRLGRQVNHRFLLFFSAFSRARTSARRYRSTSEFRLSAASGSAAWSTREAVSSTITARATSVSMGIAASHLTPASTNGRPSRAPVPLGRQDRPALPADGGQQARLAPWVRTAWRARADCLDGKDRSERRAPWAQRVPRVRRAPLELQAQRGKRARPDRRVLPALRGLRGLPGRPARASE